MNIGWCLLILAIDYVAGGLRQGNKNLNSRGYVGVGNRILGGKPTSINRVPYQVHYNGRCGGAILSPVWVLTAAHCDPLSSGSYVMVGATNKTQGVRFNVSLQIRHPQWKNPNLPEMDFDYQLILLAEPIPITRLSMPIGLASMEDITPGTTMEVTGWGRTAENATRSSDVLMSVKVPIISKQQCSAMYAVKGVEITDRMVCAGYEEGVRDSCKGDSGGPAVIGGRLAGIVSFGIGCGQANLPGVYSNVPYVADWIYEKTGITRY